MFNNTGFEAGMSIFNRMKPSFWDHEDVASGPYKHLFNFRRLWQRAVLITAIVALVPLIITALISYQLNMDTIESEFLLRTSRLVSNSWRSVSLFLSERRSALDFIAHDNTFEALNDPVRLTAILDNLNKRFGGFTDLGVLDNSGIQQTYVGPHHLDGLDYSNQAWFREVLKRGVYISEVVLGFRNEPHIDIAVKRDLPDGLFFVLRAALETGKFNELIAQFEIGEQGDAFVINRKGVLQTPSRYCGEVLNKISLPIPEPSTDTKVFVCKDSKDNKFIIGHTHIPETPFTLMIAMNKITPMQPWYKTPWAFTGFLMTSIILILLVTFGVATHLVNQIHEADQERVHTLHQVEYANKMASLGRLAAGVAHEINNPLAIINQKAGHIKDIFTLTESYAKDPKLISLADSIISTVQRSGDVAKRLLNFAGHLNMSVQTIDLKEIINEVSSVLAQDAQYRCINVHMDVANDIPQFESDRGKLEQIFFNLFNYAFSAMDDGGRFEIKARRKGTDFISITFTDNSRGIPQADLKRVFEPFFVSKTGESGTGLGLAITYALVLEIGGSINVQSQLGKGTRFDISLPLTMNNKRQGDN
jgi:signal transduction histidine kinase